MTTSTDHEQLALFPVTTNHVMHVEQAGMLGMMVTCHHCSYMAVGVTDPADLMAIIGGHTMPIASD